MRTLAEWLVVPLLLLPLAAGAAADLPFDSRLRDVVDHAYGAGGIVVRLGGHDLGHDAWAFGERFPDGLTADALADPGQAPKSSVRCQTKFR